MNAVQEDVTKLVAKELKSANEKFPLFHSNHEGYAVIKEEVEEAREETVNIELSMMDLWNRVKNNENESYEIADMIKEFAIKGATELIQVAAMAQKYLDSNLK